MKLKSKPENAFAVAQVPLNVLAAFRASEIRYRRLFETAHDGVLLVDPDTRKIVDANPFMTKLLGYARRQLVGKELFQIGLLTDEVASQKMFQKLKRKREVRYEDLPLESRGGRRREVEVVANLYQEDGHAIIQCNIRDITERKLAEKALHASEERYRNLFNSMDEGYCIIEMIFDKHQKPVDWRFLEVNPSFAKHNGLKNATGKRMRELLPQMESSWFETYGQVALTGQPVRFVNESKVMGNRWFDLYAFRVGGPASRKVAVLFTNITAHKLAEINSLRLAAIVESSDDAIIGKDLHGHITDWNKGAEKIFGYTAAEMVGNSIEHLIPADRLQEEGQILRAIKLGKSVEHFETQRKTKAGRIIDVSVTASPIRQKNGKIIGVSKTARDITERKAAREAQKRIEILAATNAELTLEIAQRKAVEAALKKSEHHYGKLLAESERLQEQLRHLSRQILLAQEEERKRISRELHDVIAQTLTGINVRLAALKKESTSNTKHLARAIASTQRLVEKSVNIVHDFARELRPAVLDDLGLIPALHSFVKNFSKRTRVHVKLTAYAGVEALDIAKRTVLFRVAQEALTNVSRHAKASQVALRIQKQAASITMDIHDNGISFSVAKLLHAKGGKRLGLLGMRERVEMIGGTFCVESAADQGTRIQVEIPLGKARVSPAKKSVTSTAFECS